MKILECYDDQKSRWAYIYEHLIRAIVNNRVAPCTTLIEGSLGHELIKELLLLVRSQLSAII